jgi:hypothetical protein
VNLPVNKNRSDPHHRLLFRADFDLIRTLILVNQHWYLDSELIFVALDLNITVTSNLSNLFDFLVQNEKNFTVFSSFLGSD